MTTGRTHVKPKKRKSLGRSDVVAGPAFPMRDRRQRRPADQLRQQLENELADIETVLKENER